MEDLILNISPEILLVAAGNFLFILILFIMNLSTKSKLKKMRVKYNRFMNGLSDKNIEQLLEHCIDRVEAVDSKNVELGNHIRNIEKSLEHCIQKIGVVRYNAFENMGSDLSFAIALLDNTDDGVVISGIYTRENSSTYAKPIVNGKCKYPLSAEEIQALDIAKKTHIEKKYT